MNSRTTLIELMHSHPIITMYDAQFSIHINTKGEMLYFKFCYIKKATEIDLLVDDVDLDEIPDGVNVGKAVIFTEFMSMLQYTTIDEQTLCSYYVQLFNRALTKFKIEEVGEV